MKQLQVVQERLNITSLEEFTARLNQEPDKAWLQKTPDGKASYIPVGIIEMQLRQDFAGLVQYEVITERRELNEYIVTARISVYHPLLQVWLKYDGIGAKVITQKKDTDLNDFTQYKQKNALEMNAPNAYAEAIKNAAKKIGKKYGADLNRKHEDHYSAIYTDEIEADIHRQAVEDRLNTIETILDLSILWDSLETNVQTELKRKFTARRQVIESREAVA